MPGGQALGESHQHLRDKPVCHRQLAADNAIMKSVSSLTLDFSKGHAIDVARRLRDEVGDLGYAPA